MLLISSELPELLSSRPVSWFCATGKLVGELRAGAEQASLLRLMAGVDRRRLSNFRQCLMFRGGAPRGFRLVSYEFPWG